MSNATILHPMTFDLFNCYNKVYSFSRLYVCMKFDAIICMNSVRSMKWICFKTKNYDTTKIIYLNLYLLFYKNVFPIYLYFLINFLVDPNSGTIQQQVLSEPSQPQGGSSHLQSSSSNSLSSSHCISCHSPLTPSNLRRDGGTLAMCDTCAKYTNMNGIRGGPTGSSTLVGVRTSGSNRRVSSAVSSVNYGVQS